MENKQINKMTNEEILRQQLELLAERSADEAISELPALTLAMIEMYKHLPKEKILELTSKELFQEALNALREEQ